MEGKNGVSLDVNSNLANSVSKKKIKVKKKQTNHMIKDEEKPMELGE